VPPAARTTVVVAHHTPDLYGSDLQLLESVSALVADSFDVVVTVPHDGPLVPLLRERGARVELLRVPVLRKSLLTPRGLVVLAGESVRGLWRAVRFLRRHRAAAVYVNTLTIPVWLLAARVSRTPALCHVHEAQDDGPRALRAALVAPLLLAGTTVVNSRASVRSIRAALPLAARRSTVVYNGIEDAPEPPLPATPVADGAPARLVQVGRLSPRKGTDVALEAVAELVRRGRNACLDVYGTVFEGYEWFEEELRARADRDDLRGRVSFGGYVHPTWAALAAATVVLVPSRTEPFGNTAVEAQLARRPVVVSDVQGLAEIVTDGETGLRVPAEDPVALADAVERLLDDPELAERMASQARAQALARFSSAGYRERMVGAMTALVGREGSSPDAS
jgi:glycosyltransferase involved in cell wall biosynthesis